MEGMINYFLSFLQHPFPFSHASFFSLEHPSFLPLQHPFPSCANVAPAINNALINNVIFFIVV